MALNVVSYSRAKIVRLITADGKFRCFDDVYPGKECDILPGTIHMHRWTDDETGEVIERLSVIMETGSERGWFPVELLDIEVN
jgi:hypothetical protein